MPTEAETCSGKKYERKKQNIEVFSREKYPIEVGKYQQHQQQPQQMNTETTQKKTLINSNYNDGPTHTRNQEERKKTCCKLTET